MERSARVYTPLIDTVIQRNNILINIALVLCFACLTAACAQVSFWIGMVPITGQTLGVILAGLFLGSRRGALSQLSYLVIGCSGMPLWFALGGPPGIARLIGPTGGYLMGFVIMAFVIGWFVEKGWSRSFWKIMLAVMAGTGVMYLSGLSWLSQYIGADNLLQYGLYPFLPGDLLKTAAAALIIRSSWVLHRVI